MSKVSSLVFQEVEQVRDYRGGATRQRFHYHGIFSKSTRGSFGDDGLSFEVSVFSYPDQDTLEYAYSKLSHFKCLHVYEIYTPSMDYFWAIESGVVDKRVDSFEFLLVTQRVSPFTGFDSRIYSTSTTHLNYHHLSLNDEFLNYFNDLQNHLFSIHKAGTSVRVLDSCLKWELDGNGTKIRLVVTNFVGDTSLFEDSEGINSDFTHLVQLIRSRLPHDLSAYRGFQEAIASYKYEMAREQSQSSKLWTFYNHFIFWTQKRLLDFIDSLCDHEIIGLLGDALESPSLLQELDKRDMLFVDWKTTINFPIGSFWHTRFTYDGFHLITNGPGSSYEKLALLRLVRNSKAHLNSWYRAHMLLADLREIFPQFISMFFSAIRELQFRGAQGDHAGLLSSQNHCAVFCGQSF